MRYPLNVALLAVLLAFQVHANAGANDPTIARLVEMRGSVLVSHAFNIASANQGLRLLPGARVLTTANAAVVVEYDNGCRVPLARNQRFVVEGVPPCALLVQSVTTRVS